jgi:hypothetical protein
MNSPNLAPDLIQTNTFLQALDADEVFTFQTFPEGVTQSIKMPPTILHGTLQEHATKLTQLNNAGHGIFFMVNQGDLQGRSAHNVVRVRALFVDSDEGPIDPLLQAAISPHIAVESSPDRGHAYFIVQDCPLVKFKERQHALAARFNGDPSVCDLPRVMRLPGFFHLKTAIPFQTRLIKPACKGQQ